MPEQALGGIPIGFGIVVEHTPSGLSCGFTFMYPVLAYPEVK